MPEFAPETGRVEYAVNALNTPVVALVKSTVVPPSEVKTVRPGRVPVPAAAEVRMALPLPAPADVPSNRLTPLL